MTDPNAPWWRHQQSPTSDLAREALDDLSRGRDELQREGAVQADVLQQQAAEKTSTVASALHAAAERAGADDDMLAGQIRHAAQSLEGLADRLRGRSLEATLGDVEDFGRRHPAVFVGMAVALGIGIGRFARSRAPDARAVAPAPQPTGGGR